MIFTYNDYLDCMSNKKIQKAIHLENKRNETKQIVKENQNLQKEDKIDEIIEELIKNREEIGEEPLIETTINKDTIKRYEMKNNNKSIIYKYKNTEKYFLIKLEKEPNYHIAYSILSECVNFIEFWKSNNLNNRQAPIIVPIVIYTGRKNWNRKANTDMKYTTFQVNSINLSYNFVDLQKCKPIELMKNKSLISNISVLKMPISDDMKKQIIDKL